MLLPPVAVSAYITHCYLGETPKWDLGGERGWGHLVFVIKELAQQGGLETQCGDGPQSTLPDLNRPAVKSVSDAMGGN